MRFASRVYERINLWSIYDCLMELWFLNSMVDGYGLDEPDAFYLNVA